ncbi:terminase [Pseudomonas fragi]|uniref:terminase n=1 Tax=Pseudomonas fragi TaxID=296 RepID=UPI000B4C2D51|nr:terminase [Pseudomonas fragi]ASC88542.1 terminase [Pseudomonas fragi]
MGKRHPNLPAWQWRSTPQSHQNTGHQAINLIAVPLLVVAFLLLVSGVFSENATSAVIGLVALFAALILKRQGHKLSSETDNSQAF